MKKRIITAALSAILITTTVCPAYADSIVAVDLEEEIIIESDDINETEIIDDEEEVAIVDSDVSIISNDEIEELDVIDNIDAVEVEIADDNDDYEFVAGYLPMVNKDPIDSIDEYATDYIGEDSIDYIPSRYVPVYSELPQLRNQGSYGTCWAHASIFLAEESMLKQGKSSDTVGSIDYSELALAYFSNYSVTDPLGGTVGDTNASSGGHDWLNDGGNVNLASQVLASWTGATSEDVIPYSNASEMHDNANNPEYEALAFNDIAHLEQIYEADITSDRDAVKKLIQENGGVAASYCEYSPYYDSSHNSYYCDVNYMTNHAIAIVGWDDNFSKDDFKVTPEGDGAWLIRNSWNNGTLESHNTYFWMSYYDESLDGCLAMKFDKANKYDNNYQYDGAMQSSYIGAGDVIKSANVFTAHAYEDGEILKAASFSTPTSNVNYTIEVYLMNADSTDPEDGTKVAEAGGMTSYQGYYTVPLDDEVALNNGDMFSVVVTLRKTGYYTAIYTECEIDGGWYKCTCAAQPGQSYLFNGIWTDYGLASNENIRIKAFTCNNDSAVEPHTFTIDSPNSAELRLGVGGKHQIEYSISPQNASRKVDWSSSNNQVVTVSDSGLIKALSKGTAVITGKTKYGNLQKKFTVIVDERPSGIRISGQDEITCQSTAQYNVNFEPAGSSTSEKVVWSSSNTSILTIDNNGKATAVGMGDVTITARLGDLKADKNVYCSGRTIFIDDIKVDENSNITMEWSNYAEYSSYEIVLSEKGSDLEAIATIPNTGKSKYTYVCDKYKGTTGIKQLYIGIRPVDYGFYSTLYDCYVGDKSTINYVLNGGTNSPHNVGFYVPNDYSVTLYDPIPPKGYRFEGWHLNSDFSDYRSFSLNNIRGKKKDYTLYANYNLIDYGVYYVGWNGGAYHFDYVKYGAYFTLYTPSTTRGGYRFIGWNTKKDGSGTSYKAGALVKNLTYIDNENVYLYEQWEKVTEDEPTIIDYKNQVVAKGIIYTIDDFKNAKSVSYSVRDIVEIDKLTGQVKTLKAGTTTATVKMSATKAYKVKFTVVEPKFKASKLYPNKGKSISTNFDKKGITDNVTYKSSNTKVATVDRYGKVTAKAVGKVTITATVQNKKYTCTVYVCDPKISGKSSVKKGQKTTLTITNGHGTTKWTSSNKKIATVTSKGVVKGIKKGKVTITAKNNGKTIKKTITVK